MSASLAVQKAIRARLVSMPEITALIPATNIVDQNTRVAVMPAIIIGEDQEVDEEDIARRNLRVYSTLHVWVKETGLTGAKAIAGAIRAAIHAGGVRDTPPFHFADCRVSSTRFLRDPDGEHSHGIVTIETLVHEVRP